MFIFSTRYHARLANVSMCRYYKEVLSTSYVLFFVVLMFSKLFTLKGTIIMHYFAFFDKKASSYLNAWPASSTAEALRAVQIGCEDAKATWAKFPGDFDLYLIADWDHTQGLMIPPTKQGPQFVEHVTACHPAFMSSKNGAKPAVKEEPLAGA